MAELERTLSFPVLLIITINSIMGTGIFFLPAVGAREAGPASIIAWIVMSLLAVAIGFIFAELVGMYPKSGGVYEYTKQAFGTFPSFMFGWATLVAANLTIAMLVVGAVLYLNPGLPYVVNIVISILIVLVFNYMAFRGMQTSAVMLVAFGLVTLGTLLALTIPGLFSFRPDNLVPFFTQPHGKILLAIFLISETFFGWETATFLAEETKDPQKTMPRALWIGTVSIAVLSLAFVLISLMNVPASEFGGSVTPLATLAGIYFNPSMIPVFSILVYLSIIGSVAGWIVAAPRLIMSLAKDKLFIQQFAEIHEKYKTPHKAIIFQTIVTSLLIVVGAGEYETLLELLVPLVLIMYAGVVASFVIMRFTKKSQPRPFRIRAGVPLGVLSILSILGLLAAWLFIAHGAIHVLALAGSFVFIGIPIYFLLTYFYNPDAIVSTLNRFTLLNVLLENILVPKRIRRRILELVPEAGGQHLLEFGAGVGTLTLHLADHVGPQGKVYAVDLSEHNVRQINKRLQKKGHSHVMPIHDPHLVNRIHPGIKSIDVAVSLGHLSYIQDVRKVLREIHRLLPQRGRICFVEYIDLFYFLPNNPDWLSHPDRIREIFESAGFSVSVRIEKGLLWNYLYVYGVKESADVPYI